MEVFGDVVVFLHRVDAIIQGNKPDAALYKKFLGIVTCFDVIPAKSA